MTEDNIPICLLNDSELNPLHLKKIISHSELLRVSVLEYAVMNVPSSIFEWDSVHLAGWLYFKHNCKVSSIKLLQSNVNGARLHELTFSQLNSILNHNSITEIERKASIYAINDLKILLSDELKLHQTKVSNSSDPIIQDNSSSETMKANLADIARTPIHVKSQNEVKNTLEYSNKIKNLEQTIENQTQTIMKLIDQTKMLESQQKMSSISPIEAPRRKDIHEQSDESFSSINFDYSTTKPSNKNSLLSDLKVVDQKENTLLSPPITPQRFTDYSFLHSSITELLDNENENITRLEHVKNNQVSFALPKVSQYEHELTHDFDMTKLELKANSVEDVNHQKYPWKDALKYYRLPNEKRNHFNIELKDTRSLISKVSLNWIRLGQWMMEDLLYYGQNVDKFHSGTEKYGMSLPFVSFHLNTIYYSAIDRNFFNCLKCLYSCINVNNFKALPQLEIQDQNEADCILIVFIFGLVNKLLSKLSSKTLSSIDKLQISVRYLLPICIFKQFSIVFHFLYISVSSIPVTRRKAVVYRIITRKLSCIYIKSFEHRFTI